MKNIIDYCDKIDELNTWSWVLLENEYVEIAYVEIAFLEVDIVKI